MRSEQYLFTSKMKNTFHLSLTILFGIVLHYSMFGIVFAQEEFYEGCGRNAMCKGIVKENLKKKSSCWETKNCDVAIKVMVKTIEPIKIYTVFVTFRSPLFEFAGMSIGRNPGMTNLFIMECVHPPGRETVAFFAYTKRKFRPKTMKEDEYPPGAKIVSVDPAGEFEVCEYELPEDVSVPQLDDDKDLLVTFSLTNDGKTVKHIGIVEGKINRGYEIKKHLGQVRYEVADIMDGYDRNPDLFIKSHGILMTITYFMLIPIATIIARFFRETWTGHSVMKKRLWFCLHVGLLYTGVLLAAIGYSCMLADFVWWPLGKTAQYHAMLGMSSMGLLLSQCVFPFLIPKRFRKFKQMYSFVHALLGTATYISGLSNIAMASYWLPLTQPCEGMLITFIWLGIHASIYIVFTTLLYISDHEMVDNEFKMRILSCPMKLETLEDSPGTRKRMILLIIFIILSLTMTLSMASLILRGGQCRRYINLPKQLNITQQNSTKKK